ncbi:protein of unknown function [Pseudomonas inefficax]|uniref:Uncharacterized protein n=1 Tax=Pseudomonas inefficax TaxID=2078786 RepID=A0AAQ1P3B1_9PSED|nr:protein of unknown function [Pseudomonas inefficax]
MPPQEMSGLLRSPFAAQGCSYKSPRPSDQLQYPPQNPLLVFDRSYLSKSHYHARPPAAVLCIAHGLGVEPGHDHLRDHR